MNLSKYLVVFFLFQTLFFVSCRKPGIDPEPEPTSSIGPNTKPEGEPLAFPGAEGYGKLTTGGRGGRVIKVTNLNDMGPGSLREAINATIDRIIVFEVSGTIALESPLNIRTGNVTIAGQSAPGDGICISNYPVRVMADNVIIRYMRFRLGDVKRVEHDALEGTGRKRIMIDHCSMSWSVDECATFYDNEDFTMQWCIIAESLNESVHSKGAHGYGGIWGGLGASFHHNLLAHHNSRLPRFNGARYHKQPSREKVDFTNNVLFNWGNNSAYGGEEGNHNMINNYYKPGPATPSNKRHRLLEAYAPYGKYYIAGNYLDGNSTITADNWNRGVDLKDGGTLTSIKSNEAFTSPLLVQQTSLEAFNAVLDKAGASLKRDAVDARIVEEVRTGVATSGKNRNGIIDSQNDVGGWPELKAAPAPLDTDKDGIPDEWEHANGLDPQNAADARYYKAGTPYTYLEVYLNSLVN